MDKHDRSYLKNLSLKNPWHFIALGMGSGLCPKAPGTMGSLVMAPDDYDYGGAYMELKEGDTLTFNDGTETEEEPYTVDGTTFSLEENGSTLKGTIENDCIALTLTAADLGGEGDAEAMVMYFGLAGSEAETKLKDEVTQAGTLDEQMEAMGTDGLMQFMEDYGYLFGQ